MQKTIVVIVDGEKELVDLLAYQEAHIVMRLAIKEELK